jgi:hypothetical protein
MSLSAANIGNAVYGILSDTFPGLQYDQPNPSNPDGGYMGAWNSLGILPEPAFYKEGGMSLKLTSFRNIYQSGMWMQYGYDGPYGDNANARVYTDLSAYSGGYIEFWAKASVPRATGEDWIFGMEYLTVDGLLGSCSKNLKADFGIPLDNQWHFVSKPISFFGNINLTQISVTAQFSTTWQDPKPAYDRILWIDNLIWRKPDQSCSFDVKLKDRDTHSEVSSRQITWNKVQIKPGLTKWKAADQYIELNMNCYYPGWVVRIYTENNPNFTGDISSAVPAGLVGTANGKNRILPMCWRLVDATTTTVTIVQHAYPNQTKTGLDYPDRLWSYELGPDFPCFVWMQDKVQLTTITNQDYATVWNDLQGIQYAEANWGAASTPNYIYLGADFSKAFVPMTFKTSLTVELFYE